MPLCWVPDAIQLQRIEGVLEDTRKLTKVIPDGLEAKHVMVIPCLMS